MFLFGPPNVEKMKARRDVNGLIRALRYKEKWHRQNAARALGELGDPRAVEPLIAALRDVSSGVRGSAAYALGKIGENRVVEPLIAALKDNNEDVRRLAAEALQEIGNTRAVNPLIAVLNDEDWGVRRAAVRALGAIKDPRAVGPLKAALSDRSGYVREAAAEALRQISVSSAVEPPKADAEVLDRMSGEHIPVDPVNMSEAHAMASEYGMIDPMLGHSPTAAALRLKQEPEGLVHVHGAVKCLCGNSLPFEVGVIGAFMSGPTITCPVCGTQVSMSSRREDTIVLVVAYVSALSSARWSAGSDRPTSSHEGEWVS